MLKRAFQALKDLGMALPLEMSEKTMNEDNLMEFQDDLNTHAPPPCRFVFEAFASINCSTIIVPTGSSRDEGWATFRNILAKINEA
ncbi:hypothetical protein Fmac_001465 [Flemingia macrophylla]|uniref:Uncharacterized protein n=1 Tax=Flemingia macrophylla TaxID=520843 RepID=A0ABD1NJZ3_9FABA